MSVRKRAASIIIREGKLLVLHRQKPRSDYYILPGGGVDLDESFEEACIREVKEETGLDALGLQLVYIRHDEHTEEHYFVTRVPPDEPVLGGVEAERQSPDNIYTLEWVTAEQLALLNLTPVASQRFCVELLRRST
jgi:8-oxo-dGTP pyrophosphatase MutT (NUDIX family)